MFTNMKVSVKQDSNEHVACKSCILCDLRTIKLNDLKRISVFYPAIWTKVL